MSPESGETSAQDALQAFAKGIKLADFLACVERGEFDESLLEIGVAVRQRRRTIREHRNVALYKRLDLGHNVRIADSTYPIELRGDRGRIVEKDDENLQVKVKFSTRPGEKWVSVDIIDDTITT